MILNFESLGTHTACIGCDLYTPVTHKVIVVMVLWRWCAGGAGGVSGAVVLVVPVVPFVLVVVVVVVLMCCDS